MSLKAVRCQQHAHLHSIFDIQTALYDERKEFSKKKKQKKNRSNPENVFELSSSAEC